MSDISNKTLGLLVGVALVISLIGLFSLPRGSFTGLVTTGQARINITETAALNVTQAMIDFGNGTVENIFSTCELTTAVGDTGDPRSCFNNQSGTDGASDGFHIQNIGNVKINITLNSTKTNTSFWGTSLGTEKYAFKCSGTGNSTVLLSLFTQPDGVTKECVSYLNSTSNQDAIRVDINITIPDLATGFKNDTITFTATKA